MSAQRICVRSHLQEFANVWGLGMCPDKEIRGSGHSSIACKKHLWIQLPCLHSNFSFYEIVRGCEPEFEEVEVVAASFSEFIDKVINEEIKS